MYHWIQNQGVPQQVADSKSRLGEGTSFYPRDISVNVLLLSVIVLRN